MKKLILIATMAATLSGLSAFAQGNFIFTGPIRGSWDIFTPSNNATPKLLATMNVGFLVNPNNVTGPLINGIAPTTRTNGLDGGLFTSTSQLATYWNMILTDPNYAVAIDTTTGLPAVASNVGNGSWTYRTGATFPVAGTSALGGPAQVYIIAWEKAYATPAAAMAGGSALGWSQVFTYNYAAGGIGTPGSTIAGTVPFGAYGVVPEPATFTLAGLGAAAMLIFRRRRK